MTDSRIAVAGATGRLGTHVVDVLTEQGHLVVPISRSNGVDVVTGEGLDDALTGVDVIIDVASWHASEEAAAAEFFRTATRNMHEAGREAGVDRIVAVSIIGADKATGGFLAAQKVHEHEHLTGPLPVRLLRASQFHEFIGQLLEWRQGDTAYVPNLPTQPVSARTVAEVLARMAFDTGTPAPGDPVPEVAGPRREILGEVAALLGARRGIKVVGIDEPDMPDAGLAADGAFLPGPHAELAGPTYREWLDAQS